ncbi:MAG: hypothetical protein PHY43_03770 [Verrucomicrobiales bacterium]|nr:hypothetical protein [Verrucomicrobiales bacterium]
MKGESQFVFGLLFVLLAAGCSTNKQGIYFISDEQLKPSVHPAEQTVPAPPQKLAKEDWFKVQVAIYGYLLQRHFLEDGEYAAVFVQGDDEEVAALIKQFPNHVPPIKTSDQADLRPNRTPLDKQTGKPAMIFSVDALDPVDDLVLAIGRWYAGGAVSGFYTFALKKQGADWVIESVK